MKMHIYLTLALLAGWNQPILADSALQSFDTGYTIMKVRSGLAQDESFIAATSYEGAILTLKTDGTVLGTNPLSGIMNNDLWCADLTGDGTDEILAANSDGSVYCLDSAGKMLWQFQPNEVPMISVCSIRAKDGETYVACGGNDLNFYWLSSTGKLLREVPSINYDTPVLPNKKWIDDGTLQHNVHVVNFLRPLPQPDGSDILLLNGILTNADQNSVLYRFSPLATQPFKTDKLGYGFGPIGDLRINGDEILIGTCGMVSTTELIRLNINTLKSNKLKLPALAKEIGHFGYRVVQGVEIKGQHDFRYLTKVGSNLLLIPDSFDHKQTEVLSCKYSFNDLCKDRQTGHIILASSQSGGSNIHIIDLDNADWKEAYEQLNPTGKIQTILDNTAQLHQRLESFEKPKWERDPITTYIMSPPKDASGLIAEIESKYKSPLFLGYYFSSNVENWDRSGLGCAEFENARDNRKSYSLTQNAVVRQATSKYNKNGLCAWGGHGVDPFYYQPETLKKIMEYGQGRKSIFIWPELTILHKKEFPFAVDHLFTPLAEAARKNNANLYIRSKHNFWLGNIYCPEWSQFLRGEFADVAVPSMEETQDQSMDLSLAGRLGIWSAGVFDDWGTRCARDNPSFTRNRQFSHQELPNHFLRNAVFHISYGARYINNFSVTSAYSDYMTVLWELIAKGALYVPKRDEIVSFNPVHLSMTTPDDRFMREAHSTTTSIRYDKDFHPQNPYVFGRMDGAWSGAAVTDWDFSNYAAGVKDRRQNFLAPYANGMVLITPPQAGVFADKDAPRGAMIDNLHPMYRGIMKEYYSDGRNYFSADGKDTFAADTYAKKIKADIVAATEKMPLTVSGEVAWVCAQTSPNHLRLTLIDSGYLNPSDKTATVTFHSIKAKRITDVLSGQKYKASQTVQIDVPCGLFSFIDIEMSAALQSGK